MSGRYGNRSAGRGGSIGKPSYIKKTVEDYYFYVGSSKQASDYEITAEFVVNHIKKTFDRGNDISEALRTLVRPDTDTWKPTLKMSVDTDTSVKQREDKQFEMEYKAELDQAMKRRRAFEDNTFKAYALLWERCNKAMQNKIASRSDYESSVFNDPIVLLQAIKEHSLNYQDTRYEMSIIADAFRSVFNSKQKEAESLQDYTRRFKTSMEILKSHLGGPIILEKYITTMDGYDASTIAINDALKDKLTKKSSECLFAYLYLENSDQGKYGTIIQNLNSQKSLGNDQYPRTIVETNNVLSSHRFDPIKRQEQDQRQQHQKTANKNKDEDDDSTPLSFAQMEGKCYCCGKPGHKSPDCRNKAKIPKEEWAINKSQQHVQSKKDDDKSTSSSVKSHDYEEEAEEEEESVTGWSGLHCSFAPTVNMRDMILLDSDSTDTVFCNPKYVTNIRDSDESLSISTNGGIMKSHQKCDIPHIENVWFNKHSITNIISMQDMTAKFRVTMDSKEELALLVHLPDKIVKFKQFSNGLYAMDPNDKKSYELTKKPYQFVSTVKENLKFLSPRQQKRARRARELYETMGTPTVDDLKAMTSMNLIKNNVVTTDDINLATKAYGPDVGGIKGKTTRNKPTPVTSNIVEIPDELLEVQQDFTVSMDGLTVGEYVQAHDEPKFTNTNAQGGHELLHLQTHQLAVLDDMPLGLQITNRANNVIFDTAWIAGVDYDENQQMKLKILMKIQMRTMIQTNQQMKLKILMKMQMRTMIQTTTMKQTYR
jgi:hypothetical protein